MFTPKSQYHEQMKYIFGGSDKYDHIVSVAIVVNRDRYCDRLVNNQ